MKHYFETVYSWPDCQRGPRYKKLGFFSKLKIKLLNPQTNERLFSSSISLCRHLHGSKRAFTDGAFHPWRCGLVQCTGEPSALAKSNSIQMLVWGQQWSAIWTWYRYLFLRKRDESINVTLNAFISEIYASCLIIWVDIYIWKRHSMSDGKPEAREGT